MKLTLLATSVLIPFLAVSPCRADALPGTAVPLAVNNASSIADSATGYDSEPSATDSSAADTAQSGTAGADDKWHVSVSPYLWLPGVHGDLGVRGRDVGFKASAGDLLSHFRFGLLGAVEARRNRLLLTNDLIFMRLSADNGLPFPRLGAISANVTANILLLTPKIGVRLINSEKIKIDALTGFRYWHFGENLTFSPGTLGLNYSPSQNWVSPLVGGRIEAPLSPKLALIIAGDVGGWGAGSQLEYQIAGVLSYQLKPKWTAQAGFRYLNVDYMGSGNAGGVVNLTLSGVVIGVTRNLSKE
jgi:hypothetical protein